MTGTDLTGEPEDDGLAAEYALGALDAAERQALARRTDTDPGFARRVAGWEEHLAQMETGFQPVTPPGRVKVAIDARLFGAAKDSILRTLWIWRAAAGALLAALVVVVVLPFLGSPDPEPMPRLVASLAADGTDVRYVAVYDAAFDRVDLSRISGEPAADRDFELWVIPAGGAPVSLGILVDGDLARMDLAEATRDLIASGATLAISVEPVGGSPTGQPTGDVVAAGSLQSI